MLLYFFFNDTATTEIYTLSLHDALPISVLALGGGYAGKLHGQHYVFHRAQVRDQIEALEHESHRVAELQSDPDRKSTRLNSSHQIISYAAFCLKKKCRTCRHLREQTCH